MGIYQSIYNFLQTPFDPDHKICAPTTTTLSIDDYMTTLMANYANDYKIEYITDSVPALDGQYIDVRIPPEQFTGFACNYAICEYRKQSDDDPNQWTTQGYICYFVRDSKVIARNVCRLWLDVDAWGTTYAHETYLVKDMHIIEGHVPVKDTTPGNFIAPRIEPVKAKAFGGSGSNEYLYDMFTGLYNLVVIFATSQGTYLYVTNLNKSFANMANDYYNIVMGATKAIMYNSDGTEKETLTGQVVAAWIIPSGITPVADPTSNYYMVGNGQVNTKFFWWTNTVISKDITIPIKYTRRLEYIVRAEIGAKIITLPYGTQLVSVRGEFGDTFCARFLVGRDEIDITDQYSLPTVSNTESQYWAQNWSSAALRGVTSGVSLIAGAATGSAGGILSGAAGLLSIGETALRVHNTPATTSYVNNSALTSARKGGVIAVYAADNATVIANDYIRYGGYCSIHANLTDIVYRAPYYYKTFYNPAEATDDTITCAYRYIKVDRCDILPCYVNKFSGEQPVARFDGGVNQAAINRLYNHMLRGISIIV